MNGSDYIGRRSFRGEVAERLKGGHPRFSSQTSLLTVPLIERVGGREVFARLRDDPSPGDALHGSGLLEATTASRAEVVQLFAAGSPRRHDPACRGDLPKDDRKNWRGLRLSRRPRYPPRGRYFFSSVPCVARFPRFRSPLRWRTTTTPVLSSVPAPNWSRSSAVSCRYLRGI